MKENGIIYKPIKIIHSPFQEPRDALIQSARATESKERNFLFGMWISWMARLSLISSPMCLVLTSVEPINSAGFPEKLTDFLKQEIMAGRIIKTMDKRYEDRHL